LPEFPNALYSRAEANDVARAIALGVIENDSPLRDATVAGRPFEPDDLQFVSHRFVESATQADTALPGNATDFPTGANVWIVTFVSRGWDTPSGPDQVNITVSFVDGTTRRLDAWVSRPDFGTGIPNVARADLGHRFTVQTLTIDGAKWDLRIHENGPPWSLGYRTDMPIPAESLRGPIARGAIETPEYYLFGLLSTRTEKSLVLFGAVGDDVAAVELESSDGARTRSLPVGPPPESRFPYSTFALAIPAPSAPTTLRAFGADGTLLAEVPASLVASME
jgi:hypothetical protein